MALKDFLDGTSPEEIEEKRGNKEKMRSKEANEAEQKACEIIDHIMIAGNKLNPAERIRFFTEAKKLFFIAKNPFELISTNLGIAMELGEGLKRFDEALAVFEETLDLCRTVDSKSAEIDVLIEMAYCYIDCNRKDKAEECFNRASLLAVEINDQEAQERILIERGALIADYVIIRSEDDMYNQNDQ